jgi:hypothetical protein
VQGRIYVQGPALRNLVGKIEALDEPRRRQEVLRAEQLAAARQRARGLAHDLFNSLMVIKVLVQAAANQGEAGAARRRLLRPGAPPPRLS